MKTEITTSLTPIPSGEAYSQQGALGKVMVAISGGTLVLAGLVMLFLPGPGMLMVLGGLSLLGTRFAFARRWLISAQHQVSRVRSRFLHA